ncbi:hypothetical protein A5N75_08195 [Prescottella equi]|nr:hypothetical protein A5N75_08195 [Prescottella equi]
MVEEAMRRKKVKNQAALAILLGVSQAMVTRMWRGDRPPIEFLAGLQTRLGVRMDRAVIVEDRYVKVAA